MKPTPELIAEAQRVVPDLDELEERLNAEPEAVLASALHRPRHAADDSRAEIDAPPEEVEVALGQPVRGIGGEGGSGPPGGAPALRLRGVVV